MSSIRFGRGREYQFFRQEDVRRNWDLRSAAQFLNGFRTDAVAMASFRRQVSKQTTASPANLSDEQVIQSLARMLVAGDFMVALPERQRHRDPIELRAPASAPSAPRAAAPVEVVEDAPTFESDHDGVAQAAVLIMAARSGFAFCEECAKHAAQQEQNKPAAKQAPAPQPAKQPASAAPANPAANNPVAKQSATPETTTQPAGVQPAGQTATNPAAKQDTATPSANPPANKPAVKQESNIPAAKQETPAPPAQPQTSTPAAKQETSTKAAEKETYWVEIALIGEDGQPIPGEEFVVELPGGKRETGVLDGNGLARFSELPTSGTCKVSFPQLDRDAWQPVSPNPK
jgi:hypothetical protein